MVQCRALRLHLDFEWEIPAVDHWISPDMCDWHIDFADQNIEGMLREALGYYFQLSIWHKAKACDTGEVPDLTEVKLLLSPRESRQGSQASLLVGGGCAGWRRHLL